MPKEIERKSAVSGLGSIGGRIGAVALVIGILALIGAWAAHRHDLDIQERGARAVGHVTARNFSQPNDWDVDYWFIVHDGQRREVRHRGISQGLWERLRVGDSIDVRYDPANPARNFPAGQGNTPLAPVLLATALGLAFAGFGAALLVGALRRPPG